MIKYLVLPDFRGLNSGKSAALNMTPLKAILLLLASGLLVLQVAAAHPHQHQHIHEQRQEQRREESNSTLESRYVLPYPYNPLSTLKRGLPFNNPSKYIQTFKGAGSKISWAYNWDSYMDPGFPKNVEFVPMLWGDAADHTTNVRKYHLSVNPYFSLTLTVGQKRERCDKSRISPHHCL